MTPIARTPRPRSAADPPAAEVLGQLGPGPMEPGLDRADGPADHLGDLLVGQALLVEQDEDHAILGPEPAEGPFELAGEVVGVGEAGPVVDPFLGRFGEDRPAPRRPRAVRQRLAAIPRSQGRSGRSASKPPIPPRARTNVSWTTSSASWRCRIIRKQRPKTTPW